MTTAAYDPEELRGIDEVAERALRRYELPGPCVVRRLNVSENVTYRVEHEDKPWAVLRVHRRGYNRIGEIESELDWVAALRHDARVSVPVVIRACDGARVVEVGWKRMIRRRCVLFEYLPGSPPTEADTAASFSELGRLSALLHLHATSWAPPADFARRSWDLSTILGDRPAWGNWWDAPGLGEPEGELLRRVGSRVRERLSRYGAATGRVGLIHADLRSPNLLVHDGTVSVLDFDDCGFSWRLFELAPPVVSLSSGGADPASAMEAWLCAYARLVPLSTEDRAAIPSLVMLRRLMVLAWLGSRRSSGSPEARRVSATTCEFAEAYLTGP